MKLIIKLNKITANFCIIWWTVQFAYVLKIEALPDPIKFSTKWFISKLLIVTNKIVAIHGF